MEKKLVIEESWCKKCGICIEFCPKKVLDVNDKSVYLKDEENCILCGLCELRCPDFAIYVEEKN
ncbi:MAG: 4Fe-4S dicluster domain-containing protein [Romboutsia sp.]|uniref:4Fe-4S dicluster domain-containing protein n=1 Tax=Romboutsia sp. TaxID=1965302 RepID=UPI003F39C7E8